MNRALAYAVLSQQLEAWRSLPRTELLLRVNQAPLTQMVETSDGSISVEVRARWLNTKQDSLEILGVAYGSSHWHTERIEEAVTVALQSPSSKPMHPEPPIVPRDKFDLAAAQAATEAGWPAVEPVAAQLLLWVQDANWPVATVLAPFLASVGAPLGPYVSQVLAGEDECWKYSLIGAVVAPSQDLTQVLRQELERIAFDPTPAEQAEEVSRAAREVLGLA